MHTLAMEKYRPNVAALVINRAGNLLICERSNFPGAWQFPQGGVDKGESVEEALYREVREEIGLKKNHYEILGFRSGYRYLYPEDVRAKKVKKHGNHGQEQTYFLCSLKDNAPPVNVHQNPPEFGAYRWILPEEFDLDWLPAFKHEVYCSVMYDFFDVELQPASPIESHSSTD
ncbi:MAG: RNA pyrophosphohydrolase [Akkermansiaceae bacterium]|jgi:putative (di)nucleoside polyphosphate hydrolase|nr:RNA pyrophosphohydrolase [Akkermansiaceae bacterium]MDP4779712.1 RNA pyrophosphohydrolase [Akkermansiaceae bacterium]MDP4846627.1 RNA pyrophosphohydrolase [Akkermansiaceae bacterium]MDP4995056.1 RNA pyrophosphohydrolase [Akkermansiaceae bacterium]